MRDEIFDRDYQAGRLEFHAGIDRALANFGRSVSEAFRVLNRVQWSAPWQSKTNRRAGRA